jgi:hypothetical protein
MLFTWNKDKNHTTVEWNGDISNYDKLKSINNKIKQNVNGRNFKSQFLRNSQQDDEYLDFHPVEDIIV